MLNSQCKTYRPDTRACLAEIQRDTQLCLFSTACTLSLRPFNPHRQFNGFEYNWSISLRISQIRNRHGNSKCAVSAEIPSYLFDVFAFSRISKVFFCKFFLVSRVKEHSVIWPTMCLPVLIVIQFCSDYGTQWNSNWVSESDLSDSPATTAVVCGVVSGIVCFSLFLMMKCFKFFRSQINFL